jgi:hypothetical protein
MNKERGIICLYILSRCLISFLTSFKHTACNFLILALLKTFFTNRPLGKLIPYLDPSTWHRPPWCPIYIEGHQRWWRPMDPAELGGGAHRQEERQPRWHRCKIVGHQRGWCSWLYTSSGGTLSYSTSILSSLPHLSPNHMPPPVIYCFGLPHSRSSP